MTSNRDYNVVCDRSGAWVKRSQCRYMWYGALVRADLWEPRHPQDILSSKDDNQTLPDARPNRPDPPLDTPPWTAADIL